jgi:hypothetical protein
VPLLHRFLPAPLTYLALSNPRFGFHLLLFKFIPPIFTRRIAADLTFEDFSSPVKR